MVKVFLDELPKHTDGTYKGCIDWTSSIGKHVRFKYEDEDDGTTIEDSLLIKDYNKDAKKITIEYNDKVSEISVSSLRDGWIKNIIGAKIKTTAGNFADFKIQIGERIIDENRDLTILDRKRVNSQKYQYRKMYKYKCNICGYDDGWSEECDILHHKIGCSCCANRTVVEGINDIPTTDHWMIPYFQGGYNEAKQYSHGSSSKINPVCPDCGKIHNKLISISSIYNRHGISCTCKDGISYPEKFFLSLLDQLKIKYTYQLTKKDFEWISNYRYDFYLLDYNCIIETHGEQHYLENNLFFHSPIIDDNKKQLALANNIKYYIEIDCRKSTVEYISNSIINSELSKIINVDGVNWIECGKFATKNLVKEVCSFYNNHNHDLDITINNYSISKTCINSYLKKGAEIGWCIYPFHSYRKIVIQKDNEYIGCFDSSKYIEDNSIEIFGIFLGQTQIIHNCNKNRNGFTKPYKGYYFITEYDYNNLIC